MEHYAQNIRGYFSEEDFNFYRYVVENATNNAYFVEVGSWLGRSTSFLAVEIINSGKNIHLDAVDTFLGSEEMQNEDVAISKNVFETFTENMKPVEGHYNAIRMESVDAAKLYHDESLDFVFIDAAHDYESVFADINAWWPKIKIGGIIGGHDIVHGPVQSAVEACFESYHRAGGSCWFRWKI